VVSYFADVGWQIASRKRAEDALRESEKALRERNLRMEKDRLPLADAVHPDAGLVKVVVHPLSLGPAELIKGAGGPGLERKRHLVGFHEVIEADGTFGEARFHLFIPASGLVVAHGL